MPGDVKVEALAKIALGVPDVYQEMGKTLGTQVQCSTCKKVLDVDPAKCLRDGFPKCCKATMTLLPKKAEPSV